MAFSEHMNFILSHPVTSKQPHKIIQIHMRHPVHKTLIPFEIAGGLNNLMQNDKPAIMQIRCKFGSLGETERQFHSPHGFCMGPNEEIIVADTFNHRIQVLKSQN